MAISTVRQSLMQRFVPENIGLNSITRENYIARHVPEFVNELYNANPNISRIIPIPHLLNLGDFYRIAGAIINRYRPVIEMQGANAELARQMLERAKTPNIVQALVEVDNLHTRNAQRWVRLDVQQILDFPILDLEYLKDLTVGIYQINLAPSYVQDKLQREGQEEFHVEMMRNIQRLPQPGLMREPADVVDELVQGYYCTCKSDARMLGTCAHIASALWYVGYAQHQQNIKYPSTRLINVIHDAANRLPPE
ncbi:hypothetical protein RF55_2196 [Lasius niger]|uniref:SWIM-type domain-containing protein n=1 Tax=Lasius niger TaxID=67767 RepID=A0A0J7L4M7_LASNI|nr:hypothetical protein RF55_2196 [Lasius niger]